MSAGADAHGVTIIFSLEIEATYDALASSCVVRDPRLGDANLLVQRERGEIATRRWCSPIVRICWRDRVPRKGISRIHYV